MSERKGLELRTCFAAFLVTTAAFVVIFLVAYSVSYLNYIGISSGTNLITGYVTRMDFLLNSSSTQCGLDLLFESSEKLDQVGGELSLLETRLGADDKRVLEQKKLYSELEFRHFNIVKNLNKNCNSDFLTILFFYSNIVDKEDPKSEEIAEDSKTMGFILGAFKNENSSRIMIYSFDFDLDSESISSLKSAYNISKPPIVIVHEKEYIYLRNIRQLEAYL